MRRRIAVAVLAGAITLAGCGSKPESAAYKACIYNVSGQHLLATAGPSTLPFAKKMVKWWAEDKQWRAALTASCVRHPNP